jgi:hypothetical protein
MSATDRPYTKLTDASSYDYEKAREATFVTSDSHSSGKWFLEDADLF